MTEPVAYKVFDNDSKREFLRFTPSPFNDNVPLYTKEQLRPLVKMTQAEFDEWKKLYKECGSWSQADNMIEYNDKYIILKSNFWSIIDKRKKLLILWATFNDKNPEETIEIVPETKWFVRSKETNRTEYNDFLLIDSERIHGWYPFVDKKIATQFDTKEEAKKWTNPLTEAVQLPVEDE